MAISKKDKFTKALKFSGSATGLFDKAFSDLSTSDKLLVEHDTELQAQIDALGARRRAIADQKDRNNTIAQKLSFLVEA